MRTTHALLLEVLLGSFLAACGNEEPKDTVTLPAGTPQQVREGIQEALDRSKVDGLDPQSLRGKMEEAAERGRARFTKPLTDAELDSFVAVMPEWREAAKGGPEALKAVLDKHGMDTIGWSQLAGRVSSLYTLLRTPGTPVPKNLEADAEVMRRHMDRIAAAIR